MCNFTLPSLRWVTHRLRRLQAPLSLVLSLLPHPPPPHSVATTRPLSGPCSVRVTSRSRAARDPARSARRFWTSSARVSTGRILVLLSCRYVTLSFISFRCSPANRPSTFSAKAAGRTGAFSTLSSSRTVNYVLVAWKVRPFICYMMLFLTRFRLRLQGPRYDSKRARAQRGNVQASQQGTELQRPTARASSWHRSRSAPRRLDEHRGIVVSWHRAGGCSYPGSSVLFHGRSCRCARSAACRSRRWTQRRHALPHQVRSQHHWPQEERLRCSARGLCAIQLVRVPAR